MSAARSVTATFNVQRFTLTVGEAGTGSGTVTSSDGSIGCPGTCAATYNSGSSVTLTARDRKSTRLNSSHEWNSYAVFCWKKNMGGVVPEVRLEPRVVARVALGRRLRHHRRRQKRRAADLDDAGEAQLAEHQLCRLDDLTA